MLSDNEDKASKAVEPLARYAKLIINTTTQGILMNVQPNRTKCSFLSQLLLALSTLSLAVLFVMPVHVVLADAGAEFTVANGVLSLAAPAGWKQPRSRIVETEFI